MNATNATFANSTLANATSTFANATRPTGYSNGTNYPDGAFVAFAFMIAIALCCCYNCTKKCKTARHEIETTRVSGAPMTPVYV
jgi:hypothetical protein